MNINTKDFLKDILKQYLVYVKVKEEIDLEVFNNYLKENKTFEVIYIKLEYETRIKEHIGIMFSKVQEAVKSEEKKEKIIEEITKEINGRELKIRDVKQFIEIFIDLVKYYEKNTSVKPQKASNSFLTYDEYLKNPDSFYNFYGLRNEIVDVIKLFIPDIYSVVKVDFGSEVDEKTFENEDICFNSIELLQQQKILLVAGAYGSGKTVFLKKLHYFLQKEKNENVFTLQCKDLMEVLEGKKEKFFELLDYLNDKNENGYILLDALDDLNVKIDSSEGHKTYLIQCLNWLMEFLLLRKNYYILVTSRNYVSIENRQKEMEVYQEFANSYVDEFNSTIFSYIKVRDMSIEDSNKWIKLYNEITGKDVTKSRIKEENHRVANGFSNPLFLYIVLRSYNRSKSQNIYDYYNNFINETIKGKYALESTRGAKALNWYKEGGISKYRELLESIAFDILNRNQNKLDELKYTTEEFPVLGNKVLNENFYIGFDEFSEATKSKFESFEPTGEDYANLINCFFVVKMGNHVFFKDTNIMFVLCANHIYSTLNQIIENENGNFKFENLSEMKMVNFYPMLLDFILYLIKKDHKECAFCNYSYSAIIENEFIKKKMVSYTKEDVDLISKLLLLYVIFLKFNRNIYTEKLELQHFLKDVMHYVNIYKEKQYIGTKERYAYSIERYFMEISFMGVLAKRLNLKYYNFKGALLEKSIFLQCKFDDTNMENIRIETKLEFELCRMTKMSLSSTENNSNAQIDIKDSFIENAEFKINKRISFKRCYLKNATIDIIPEGVAIFEDCIFEKLVLKSSNIGAKRYISIKNCIFKNPIVIQDLKKALIKKEGDCLKSTDSMFFSSARISEGITLEGF